MNLPTKSFIVRSKILKAYELDHLLHKSPCKIYECQSRIFSHCPTAYLHAKSISFGWKWLVIQVFLSMLCPIADVVYPEIPCWEITGLFNLARGGHESQRCLFPPCRATADKRISWSREPRKYSYKLNLILLRFQGIQFWVLILGKRASLAV